MNQKLVRAIKSLHVGQRGMTGLETAIILIAFVTVASVLAYSVLSAGIFSAEKGKETVYSGLESAQSSLEIKGAVIGYSSDNSELTSLRIKIGMAIDDEKVDKTAIYLTYFDADYSEQLTTSDFTLTKLAGSTERGAENMIEGDEVWLLTVTIPTSATINANNWCAIQVVPPTGASLQIRRTMPGYLDDYFSLH
jgi:archaeal flagellin FlaB